jgi:hypothetical protein
MKLSNVPTPETDELFKDVSGQREYKLLVGGAFLYQSKSLERRLALAVAALRSARKALCSAHYALLETAPCAAETCKQTQSEAVVSAELACRIEIKVTSETLAQIEKGTK